MQTEGREVAGRQFRTAADYEAAVKDAAYIEQIKQRYHLDSKEELDSLIKDLRDGKYRFRTILGQDFLEEMENYTIEENVPPKRKDVKKGNKTVVKAKKSKDAKNKAKLEDYDADMQKSILLEIRKRERIRKWLMTVCVCIAAACFTYLGIYSYQISRLDAYAEKQQNLKGAEAPASGPETPVIHYDTEEIEVPDILEEYKILYSLNKRLIGWVKIDDTYIDYPVLQTTNNEL